MILKKKKIRRPEAPQIKKWYTKIKNLNKKPCHQLEQNDERIEQIKEN